MSVAAAAAISRLRGVSCEAHANVAHFCPFSDGRAGVATSFIMIQAILNGFDCAVRLEYGLAAMLAAR